MRTSLVRPRHKIAFLAAPLIMAVLAACGTSQSNVPAAASAGTSQTVKVPVGGGQYITVHGPPHIAYFPAGNNNNYLTIRGDEVAKDVRQIPGATVDTFNADWVPRTQLSMIETAIASNKYNAFLVDTDDGTGECNILSKTAPAHNIAVVNLSTPICGLNRIPNGRDQVATGTVGAVGNQNIDAIRDYLLYMIKQNPGPKNVIVLTGPPLHPLTPEIDAALAIIKRTNPQFHIIANVATDFSTLQGEQKTAPLLGSNTKPTIIYSAYADITVGAITALRAAGMLGKVKIYDTFGSRAIVNDIKNGIVQSTTGGYPAGSVDAGFAIIDKAFRGVPFQRAVLGDGGPVPANVANWSGVDIINKGNLANYHPQF